MLLRRWICGYLRPFAPFSWLPLICSCLDFCFGELNSLIAQRYHSTFYFSLNNSFPQCLPNSPDVCTLPRSYTRILVLLVDAFRYDFAVFDENADESSLPPFKNRMPKLHSLLQHSDNSRLFKIYADPPTTTMQWIKAITTGSFPTFVEGRVSKN